jgi:hypothetical protein
MKERENISPNENRASGFVSVSHMVIPIAIVLPLSLKVGANAESYSGIVGCAWSAEVAFFAAICRSVPGVSYLSSIDAI